jgi:hypothetical protein
MKISIVSMSSSDDILSRAPCGLEPNEQPGGFQITTPPHIGDINALVLESSPSGSCRYKGHSLADGIYLVVIAQTIQMSIWASTTDHITNMKYGN